MKRRATRHGPAELPSAELPSTLWPYRWPVLVGIVVTASLGVALRSALAGWLSLPGEFPNLRHAHSHGGVYVVLFPLCLVAWRDAGIATPGRGWMRLYFAACAVAVVTFAWAGYVLVSIVASTLIATVWLATAYLGRAVLRRARGALRIMPLAFLATTLFVPPIAMATRSDPALADALAHSFLATLFLLAMLPIALHRIGAGALDARVFVPAAALSAAHLGVAPGPLGSIALVVLGIQVSYAVRTRTVALPLRIGWTLFGAGALGLAVFPIPPHHLTVGGLHYLLLGPLPASLALLHARGSGWMCGCAAAMAGALGWANWGLAAATTHGAAAVAGGVWMIVATLSFVARWRAPPPQHQWAPGRPDDTARPSPPR